MSAPFRELFNELSDELFEALKGIGEQAVREATSVSVPVHRGSNWRVLLNSTETRIALCERYQWSNVAVRPMAHDCCTEIIATLECGHRVRYRLDELRFVHARDFIEAVDHASNRFPRTCFCTPRPEHL